MRRTRARNFCYNRFMKALMFVLAAVLSVSVLSGCSIIKEGITGERPEAEPEAPDVQEEAPARPAAFPIIGDWYGVYSGSEYLSLKFTSSGKCELQPAVYPSDMFGPRYFGEYKWGGEDGREIILDLYKGEVKEADTGTDDDFFWQWEDKGRANASTALMMTFRVYGSTMKSFALKAAGAGIDTDGYTVVKPGAFIVLISEQTGPDAEWIPWIFGADPFDETEGKKNNPSAPDTFLDRSERFYTTAELNVRCGPSTSYGTYGTVPVGTAADKIGEASGNEEWAFVLMQDGGGWMHVDYLQATPPVKNG